jgi:hypothetical protein
MARSQHEGPTGAPPGFERTFEFTFPLEQFPNLCIRLRGTPARLEEIVRDVPRDVLIRKPGAKWSAQEHAGHLLDLEPLWAARADDFIAGNDTLTVADLRNRKTDEGNHNTRDRSPVLRRGTRRSPSRRRFGVGCAVRPAFQVTFWLTRARTGVCAAS